MLESKYRHFEQTRIGDDVLSNLDSRTLASLQVSDDRFVLVAIVCWRVFRHRRSWRREVRSKRFDAAAAVRRQMTFARLRRSLNPSESLRHHAQPRTLYDAVTQPPNEPTTTHFLALSVEDRSRTAGSQTTRLATKRLGSGNLV